MRGRATTPAQPPVLVVSLPRSGSSWVGEVLGAAPDAMYLREPITQRYLETSEDGISVFFVPPDQPPRNYRAFADNAFAGIPAFGPNILKRPGQWSLLQRRRRHMVIKDVNPLALSWLAQRYRPRIIFLTRHPVAVANSYHRLGWGDVELASRLPKARLREVQARFPSLNGFWEEHAAFQGIVTRMALEMLNDYPDARLIRYEDLCGEPLEVFHSLYEFAGLTWTEESQQLVASRSRSPSDAKAKDDPYSTARDSASQVFAWRDAVGPDEVARIRRVYTGFELPLYADASWW